MRKSPFSCLLVCREVNEEFANVAVYCKIMRKESSRLNCQFHLVRIIWLLKMPAGLSRSLNRENRYVLSILSAETGRNETTAPALSERARKGAHAVATVAGNPGHGIGACAAGGTKFTASPHW